MDWSRLLPATLAARDDARAVQRHAAPISEDARRAALLSIEADLLIVLMQAPGIVRVPLICAAVLVRLARG
jgi:hypothetical protein